jgi:tetratricopeptide (TPR) repeat protein
VALVQLKRPQESLSHFVAAMEGMPRDPELRFNYAAALSQLQRYPEAMAALQQVVDLDPSHDAAREALNRMTEALTPP